MFNVFDVIVIIITSLCVFFGFQTGVLASIFYILSGFIGMLAATRYSPKSTGSSFFIIFFAYSGAVILIGYILGKVFKKAMLGSFDRAAGIVLGIILGFAIAGTLIVLPLSMTNNLPFGIHKKALNSYTGKKVVPWVENKFKEARQFKFRQLAEKVHIPLPKMPEIFGDKSDKTIKKKEAK
jgi:uncharacterized membrane protein required for colicin V production